jgi:ferredoxin
VATRSRLKVDWPACQAHGVCAELLPELVGLDEWGYPLIPEPDVPRALMGHAQRAVTACPTLALSLVEAPPDPPGSARRRRH